MKSAVLLKFFLSVSFSLVVNGFALPFEGLFPLDIIHYNDFHARFEETSIDTPTCRYNNNSCLGGFPRLFHEIHVLLKQKPDAILLNAGDSFQGTYWYTLLKWNVTQEFMNLLPHDAHAIGNHEFDDGVLGLVPYLKALKAPALAANMDVSNEPALMGLFQPSTVLKRHGRKIGIIGLITPDTQNLASSGNVIFTDPGEATRREALALTEQGVDIIILLSHCGIDRDLFMPNGIYLDARNLTSKELAEQIVLAMNDVNKYYDFFKWHNHYSYHGVEETPETDPYCNLCDYINKWNGTRVVQDLERWWNE